MPQRLERTEFRWIGAQEPTELLCAHYRTHAFAPHIHDTYVVGVVEAGATIVRYRGHDRVHRSGGVFVVEPGQVHSTRPCGAGGWRYRAVYPSVDLMRALAKRGRPGAELSPRFTSALYEDAPLAARLVAVHRALERDARSPAAESRLRAALTILLARHACFATADDDATPSARVQRACRHVRAHYARAVALRELADVAGLSPYHFIRVFRQEVGLAPYTYLEMVRVEEAKRLLRDGTPPSQVAYATGFSDQSHLTRMFKRVVGVTPGGYVRGWERWGGADAPRARRR